MDKWKELKRYLIGELRSISTLDPKYHGYVHILEFMQDLEVIEITNKTHGHEGTE